MKNPYGEIYGYLKDIEIIDTHEHLPPWEKKRNTDGDVFSEFLQHYMNRDLISAGMPPETCGKLLAPGLTIREKWELASPYWEYCRYTGYGRSLEIAVRDIYGISHIGGDTIEALNDAFRQSMNEGHYEKVLHEMSHIKVSILDALEPEFSPPDPAFFRPVRRINRFVFPLGGADLMDLERESGVTISTFDDYLEACNIAVAHYAEYCAGLKCSLAYDRSLYFPRAARCDAERAFNEFFRSNYYIEREERVFCPGEAFQNYMMHHVLDAAQKHHMVIQMHTGMQEGSGNIVANSNPALLSNLFLEYPGVRFDVFHIGYPYYHELGALAKMFPNVYADMSWAHILCPAAARSALSEWLESVPYNKIFGFGGDYCLVDGVYAHQYMARIHISRVLADKVEEGLFDTDKAKEIGRAILYDNPANLFGIK